MIEDIPGTKDAIVRSDNGGADESPAWNEWIRCACWRALLWLISGVCHLWCVMSRNIRRPFSVSCHSDSWRPSRCRMIHLTKVSLGLLASLAITVAEGMLQMCLFVSLFLTLVSRSRLCLPRWEDRHGHRGRGWRQFRLPDPGGRQVLRQRGLRGEVRDGGDMRQDELLLLILQTGQGRHSLCEVKEKQEVSIDK